VSDRWWRRGVLYQIYPRSFLDTDGDGIGDLRGVIEKLDYLEWLGVTGVWLNPITPSPDVDFGYDVSHYTSVHPVLGTADTLDELIAEAATRGISVVLDIVPSHTSDQHPWFLEARASRSSRYRHYYVWRPPGPNGARPNNWIGYFGEPAWSFDDRTGEYYMHNFAPQQPQLNWWNRDVRAEFDGVLRFWFERGVAGVRMDAVQTLLYDPDFRDNPPAGPADSRKERQTGQAFRFNANHPAVHEIIRGWRALVDRFEPPRLLFGETWVPSIPRMAEYYGNDDGVHLAWNVPFLQSELTADALGQVIAETFAHIPAGAWPVWAISTHDAEGRAPARWCEHDPACTRCALLLLLTLRGTPVIYYGDEIGMSGLPPARLAGGLQHDGHPEASRHASRTPMQWRGDARGGFTAADAPWLPIADAAETNVEAQRADRSSTLWFVRDLLSLRRSVGALSSGAFEIVRVTADLLAWQRDRAVVGLNIGREPRRVDAFGTIAICTDRARDGERVSGVLELGPMQGAVVLP
jgi:alpha-glucosidase